MRTIQNLFMALVVTAATLAAQGPLQGPLIGLVVNAASGNQPGLPNSGIAQGSLVKIWGFGLGGTLEIAPQPLRMSLAGTSVTITVNGTTVTALMCWTQWNQVGAVVPSNTPVGTGMLTLTYNGNSGSSPITVVPTNFGIYNATVDVNNASGLLSLASVTFPDYEYVTVTNTAKPGDTLTVWGTGLGATPNNGGDTDAAPEANIGNAPQVFVGGIPSPSVTYWGRSPNTIPGLDQINFVVPQNAPLGCTVSIVVQTDAITVSNAPTVALATADGAICSDPTQILPPSLSKSGSKVMFLGLQDAVSDPDSNGMNATTYSSARVLFYEFDEALPVSTTQGELGVSPSLGNCYTENLSLFGSGDDGLPVSALNAGTSITLTSSSGNEITLGTPGSGYFISTTSSNLLPSGTWSFSNGGGGSDIGPLSFTFTVPQQVVWTNQAVVSGSPIDRASPLKITWTGGDSNGYVHILGFSGEAAFECAAATSPGEFTIPPSILLGLPAGTQSGIQVSTRTIPFSFGPVPGLDLVEDISTFTTSVSVVFK
jgi:uncharacterized protein (TIGR03437 family)